MPRRAAAGGRTAAHRTRAAATGSDAKTQLVTEVISMKRRHHENADFIPVQKMRRGMKSVFVYLTAALWLTGCVSVTTPPVIVEAPPPKPKPPVIEAPPKAKSANPAVLALLDDAQTNTAASQPEAAGAVLERALRIEPRNPWLWLELAKTRLAEGQYQQAIMLAKKSNSFAGRQPRIQSENWHVIGQALEAQGDTPGAEEAYGRADALKP
jgi:tetratricopeptide (TPR) repeat protein